jgi:hypothetical protein
VHTDALVNNTISGKPYEIVAHFGSVLNIIMPIHGFESVSYILGITMFRDCQFVPSQYRVFLKSVLLPELCYCHVTCQYEYRS